MALLLSKTEKKRHYRRLRFRIYLFSSLAVLAVILAFYGLLNLRSFRIESFEVFGKADLEAVKPAILASFSGRFLGLRHFFSWPEEVNGIKVEKLWAERKIRLIGADPKRFAIWCLPDSCHWLEYGGKVIEAAPDTDGDAIFKINDSRQLSPKPGDPVIGADLFRNLAAVLEGAAELPITIRDLSYDHKHQELTLKGGRGEKLIFSVRFQPTEKTLGSLLELITSGKARQAEYVDLTVENRIYLK